MEGENEIPIEQALIGQILAERYHIQRMIASGHYGVVFLAHHQLFNHFIRRVAIKVTRAGHITPRNASDIFRDAIILARILEGNPDPVASRYLVRVHDVGLLPEWDHRGFLAMEYIEGGTLQDHIRASKKLPVATGWRYAEQICEGLSLAHRSADQVVHRDLKPTNILIDHASDEVRVADFGLAQRLRSISDLSLSNPAPLEYKAPEAMRDDTRCESDVYSLGVVFYEMFTGLHPFRNILEPHEMPESDRIEYHRRMRKELHLEPPSRYNPDLTPSMDEIIMTCLKFEFTERYRDAADLLKEIRKLRGGVKDPRLAYYENGLKAMERDDCIAGEAAFRKASELSKNKNDCLHLNITLALAHALQKNDKLEEAYKRFEEADKLDRTSGMLRPAEQAVMFSDIASLLRAMNNIALACRYDEKAKRIKSR